MGHVKGVDCYLKVNEVFETGRPCDQSCIGNDCGHDVDSVLKVGWGMEVIKTRGTCWESRKSE